jgi:hypothetical protein
MCMCGCEHKEHRLPWHQRIGWIGFLLIVPTGSFLVYKLLMLMRFYEKIF